MLFDGYLLSDHMLRAIGGLLVYFLVVGGLFLLVQFLLGLPLRRAERARLFLEVLESSLHRGVSVEETILSLAASRDRTLGVDLFLLAAWIEQNLSLGEALRRCPFFLPPQIVAMLQAGEKMGDLKKVLPACHCPLRDAKSQTNGALSYVIILTFVISPAALWIFAVLQIFVVPKFLEIGLAMGGNDSLIQFVFAHGKIIFWTQLALLLTLWGGALGYLCGPRHFLPRCLLPAIHFLVPWRRKRMQRDFSTMLAVLLDAGMTEPEAVQLAAECSANKIFTKRAARIVEELKKGVKLPDTLWILDESQEAGWRLKNAFQGRGGFLSALSGWHETLEAKAFQQEQAAAHIMTSALVLWNGVFVGLIAFSVFMFLISLIDSGVLW